MAYDLTQVQQLLEIARTRDLTSKERARAREEIGAYYARKLASLQQNLFAAIEKRHTGELNPFDVDEYIHRYHKQSQELYSYINAQAHSNARLRLWLAAIDADERGEAVWEPRTKLFGEEEEKSG